MASRAHQADAKDTVSGLRRLGVVVRVDLVGKEERPRVEPPVPPDELLAGDRNRVRLCDEEPVLF
jgi:hypothetical protein